MSRFFIYPLVLFSFLSVSTISAQNENKINKQLAWKDVCYDLQIGNIQLYKGDEEISLPLLTLGMNEFLTLRFDDLSTTRSSLRYTIVHCNADWEEDNLFLNEYMDGFQENWFNNSMHSHAARVGYQHYELQIPNRDVQLKVSGNYLLKVYERDASKPVFVRGFSIVEPKSTATLHVRPPMLTGERCLQQLEILVNHPQLEVRNAFRELKVRVEQNGYRLPNAEQPTPTFVENNRTSFSQPDRNWYMGGNEFRFLDTRNLEFSGQGVAQMTTDDNGRAYAFLYPDDSRDRTYLYSRDLNGLYRTDAYRTRNRFIEADYVTSIFTLNAFNPFDGEVYVFGKLSNFTLHPEFRMDYNEERQAYELNALLKQGLYNYRYLLVANDGKVDWEAIEGCFAETENNYNVYVYYRGIRDRHDRLVGVFTINTATNR